VERGSEAWQLSAGVKTYEFTIGGITESPNHHPFSHFRVPSGGQAHNVHVGRLFFDPVWDAQFYPSPDLKPFGGSTNHIPRMEFIDVKDY
jgi:hypothetical protein